MNVKFYKMTSPKIQAEKQKTLIQNSECQLFETTDILDPIFVVKYNKNVMSSNYVYCDEFERFYFVKDKQIVDGNRIKISCHVDVLSTYWNQIKSTSQHIVRNSEQFNLYMNDNVMQITQRTMKSVRRAHEPAGGFPFLRTPDSVGHNFILNSI